MRVNSDEAMKKAILARRDEDVSWPEFIKRRKKAASAKKIGPQSKLSDIIGG